MVTRYTNPGLSPSQTPKLAWMLAQVKRCLGACHIGESLTGPVWFHCLTPCFPLGDFKKFDRTSSSGTMSSSEELVDQEAGLVASAFDSGEGPPKGPEHWKAHEHDLSNWPFILSTADLNGMDPELPVAMPSGPFRHVGLSKAAHTHRLRKLRTPAKCRECNSYVYFQGAECEEVCGDLEPWALSMGTGVYPALGSILSFTKSRRWWRTPVSHPSSWGRGRT